MESPFTLELSNCSKCKENPKFVVNNEFLQEIFLDRTAIVELIKNFPENLWIVKGLEILDLSKADIEELPSSIERLTNLTSLTLRYCVNLVRLPDTICSLKLLNSIDLFGCLKFGNLPTNIGNVKGLELLNLCWTAIEEVPSSIVLLKNLKHLYICIWKSSEFYSLPTNLELMGLVFPSLISLPTSRHPTRELLYSFDSLAQRFERPFDSLPRGHPIRNFLHSLGSLAQDMEPICPEFVSFDSLPTNPHPLLPSLLGLQSLTYLHFSDCNLWSIPNDIGCLSSLEHLNLSGNSFASLPKSISQLSNLRTLYLEGCQWLQSLENVPSTIDSVIANNCTSLERLPELQFYPFRSNHSHLNFQCVNCFKLVDYIQNSSNVLQVSLSLSLSL
ncbi:disease resistance protein RPV1-like [Quercus suber]|uniref:disease resistance protein RPV1-like n=1 Tax=Quercus suber TaxID=58331 RepID=UPI0032DF28D3